MKNEKLRRLLIVLPVLIGLLMIVSGPIEAMMTVEDIGVAEVAIEQEEATEEAEEKEVEYALPWPGILPDHPLYFLKMARDRIWGFLVRDPAKKAEWALLMADKRVWSGQMLLDKEKEALAVTTLTKAEKYLEQALFRAQEAKAQGGNVDVFLDKLSLAAQKHEQILEEALETVSEESRLVIEKTLSYPRRVHEQAEELKE